MSRSRRVTHFMTVPSSWKKLRRHWVRQAMKQALIHGRDPERERKSDRYNYW
jgi:hypothetical protein